MRSGVLLALGLAFQIVNPFVSVSSLRDKARPLLIFSVEEQDARFKQQTMTLAEHADALAERQVVGISMPTRGDRTELDTRIWASAAPSEVMTERRRFHVMPHQFVVILLGKDGGEKKRWTRPVTFDELRATIDAMPMRQDEMRQSAGKPQ